MSLSDVTLMSYACVVQDIQKHVAPYDKAILVSWGQIS